jgi:hypothetical protein
MPRTARLIEAVRSAALIDALRDRAKALVSSRGQAPGLHRGKTLVFAGAAAALVGAGAASAAGGAPASAATFGQQTALAGGGSAATLVLPPTAQVAAALDPGQGQATGPGAPQFASAQPYEIYDSVTPSAIPAGHVVATYADGPFAVSPAAMAGKQVLWIDTNGSDPQANALDVEPGDVTPAVAGNWAAQKLAADPGGQAILYTMESEWPAVQAAVRTAVPAAEQSQVRWWIADPTGVPHMVPGASATQWYWGSSYDVSTANPGF